MSSLWLPEVSIWEKILRSAVVYLFLLLAFRLAGKRQIGQLTPFDLVVLLIIANVVQNAGPITRSAAASSARRSSCCSTTSSSR